MESLPLCPCPTCAGAWPWAGTGEGQPVVSRQGGSLTEDGGGRVGGASGDHTAQSTDLYVNEPPFPLFFYKPLCNFDSAYPSSWTRDRAPSVIPGVSLFLIFLPLFQSPQGSSPPPWWGNSVCSCECVQEALHPHSWMLRSSGPQPGTPFRPGLPRGQAPWGTGWLDPENHCLLLDLRESPKL